MTCELKTDQYLQTGETLEATNGSCFAIMQNDGNFCMYSGSPKKPGEYIWSALSKSLPHADYFAIMQSDGNFCVYKGKGPKESHGFVWGSGSVAPGGQFTLTIENHKNIVISANAPTPKIIWAARTLRLLTYNLHIMEGSIIEDGARLAGKLPVVFHDAPRYKEIVGRIARCGADVVALQEVWSADYMKQTMLDLKHEYPHSVRGSSGVIYKAGSGIVLLSKWPITDWDFNQFAAAPIEEEEDSWATKGVLSATVVVNGTSFRVGMTHAWTNAGDARCDNIPFLLKWTRNGFSGLPAVIIGDLNIHRKRPEFSRLEELMRNEEAYDSWALAHGISPVGSETDDQIHNNLSQFFSPARDTPEPDCIDYAYVKSGSPAMRVFRAEVLRDWKMWSSGPSMWYRVHVGTVSGKPSAVVFCNSLLVISRSNETRRLQSALYSNETGRWEYRDVSDGLEIMASDGAPGVVWYNSTLHLFFQQGGQVFKLESRDGKHWSKKTDQGSQVKSSGGVCPVVFMNTIYLFCRDPGGNQVCCHKWTDRWSSRMWVGIDTRHDISCATFGSGTKLCVTTIDAGRNTGLMRSITEDGAKWNSAQMGRNITCSASPAIMEKDGKLHVFYRSPDGGDIFHRSSNDGIQWTSWDFEAKQVTADEVCPIDFFGQIMLFYSYWKKDSAIQYKQRALVHMLYPPQVNLDLSDHYPYQIDITFP